MIDKAYELDEEELDNVIGGMSYDIQSGLEELSLYPTVKCKFCQSEFPLQDFVASDTCPICGHERYGDVDFDAFTIVKLRTAFKIKNPGI